MGPFSPEIPVIPAEISVIPALRRGYLAAFTSRVCAQHGAITATSAAMKEFCLSSWLI